MFYVLLGFDVRFCWFISWAVGFESAARAKSIPQGLKPDCEAWCETQG